MSSLIDMISLLPGAAFHRSGAPCMSMCWALQGSAKRWALGCVNSSPAARGSQEAVFTQPRAHLLAYPCILTMSIGASAGDGNNEQGIHCLLRTQEPIFEFD